MGRTPGSQFLIFAHPDDVDVGDDDRVAGRR